MADNVTGNISPQDLRDMIVTIMEADFANPGDFWCEPGVANMVTDKIVKGWIDVSQIMLSEISFGRVCYMTTAGKWAPASALTSGQNNVLGVAADSYAAAESQAQILRRGLVYDSALSARFSDYVGRVLYLVSGLPGSISVTANTGSNRIIGFVEMSGASVAASTTSGHWRFDPTWAVSGV
jgi:hypothetical protein